MSLSLRNPHSVLAALRNRPGSVMEVRLSSARPHGAWQDVVDEAQQQRVPIRTGGHSRQQKGRGKDRRESSAEATVREIDPVTVDQLLLPATDKPQGNRVWLALDCVQDPHNVGAIFRSAAFFGVAGVVMTKDKSAPMNAAVYDVASGGVEVVPVCVVANLVTTFDRAKEAGVWVLGASEHADDDVMDIPRDRHWMLVIGNEEKGLRSLTLKRCDQTCSIHPRVPTGTDVVVGSLNASVATAVLLGELTRS